MNQCVPIRHLFETHLTVSDLRRSIDFYRDVIGLQLAFEAPQRNVAFFWIGESGCSMLGLWSIDTAPLGLTLHLAFDVLLDDLLGAHKILKASGITTFSILGEETIEPSVICWMPAAAIYFRDPDGHLLEYLTLLNEAPRPDLGITSWSDWLNIKDRAVRSEIS